MVGKKKYHSNILIPFLDLLSVPYTKSYIDKVYNEHPHKNNLYGLSQILEDYNIENTAIKVKDRESDIFSLPLPFIAFVGNDFVTVKRVSEDNVYYIGNGIEIIAPFPNFINIWTGIALLAEKKEDSIEPNYYENKKRTIINDCQKMLLTLVSLAVLAILLFINKIYLNIGLSILVTINSIGVYISYLLINKQLNVKNIYTDKICSLFNKGDCNEVLNSKASKLWNIWEWSEVGFSYFISNLLLIVLVPDLIYCLAIINICTLPYTLWSIWYQKYIAKQWCPLCLIVQCLLWLLFLVNLFCNFIYRPDISIIAIVIVASIYIIPLLIISLIIPLIIRSSQMRNIKQEINSIKASTDIFSILLKQQPYYPVNRDISKILIGNKCAKNLITIISNPLCNPCAKLHNQVDNFLKKNKDKIAIQYILTSFKGKEDNTLSLISSLLNNKANKETVLTEWYNLKRKEFNSSNQTDTSQTLSNTVKEEYNSHEEWCNIHKINSTPTILFNGYRLPEYYKIEDMVYFLDLEVDSR